MACGPLPDSHTKETHRHCMFRRPCSNLVQRAVTWLQRNLSISVVNTLVNKPTQATWPDTRNTWMENTHGGDRLFPFQMLIISPWKVFPSLSWNRFIGQNLQSFCLVCISLYSETSYQGKSPLWLFVSMVFSMTWTTSGKEWLGVEFSRDSHR